MLKLLARLTFLALGTAGAATIHAAVMYGSNGNSGINTGALVTLDQSTGAGTVVGDPWTPGGVAGLAFNAAGDLYGTTVGSGGVNLIRINPDTGALISTVGALGVSIGDISFSPTGVLYGISSNTAGTGGTLYTISLATGLATAVGATGISTGGGLAFAPDGTLFFSSYEPGAVPYGLNTLDPTTGAITSTVHLDSFIDALGIRSDGTLFGSLGATDDIVTINTVTGAITSLGDAGTGNVSDIDFRPEANVPAPATLALLGLGLVAMRLGRRHRRTA